MANELKMAIVESIFQLRSLRWSARRIARELGIDRGTVRKYLRRSGSAPKPAIPPAGSAGSKPATSPPVPGGCEADAGPACSAASGCEPKPARPSADGARPAGPPGESPGSGTAAVSPVKRGRPSECEPHLAVVQGKLDQGLTAQRIFQDLVVDHGFAGSYDSVKRFVRQLGRSRPLPMRRMECGPGEDYGKWNAMLSRLPTNQ
jgi:hypothetical protein